MAVDVLASLRSVKASLGEEVEARAGELLRLCSERGRTPRESCVVVMTGGGKDSSLALILVSGICQIAGAPLVAVSMAHPGLSRDTITNVEALCGLLDVRHEWRAFLRRSAGGAEDHALWAPLYRALHEATGVSARFMCVACNLGSIVTEYAALAENGATFLVTGNPPQELQAFERWAASLKLEFGALIDFPALTGVALLDTYRLWWAVYRRLLSELSEVGAGLQESDYLYDFPAGDDPVGNVLSFPVLGANYDPVQNQQLLHSFGWRLPQDIQGGTESDCRMPAAIASIEIARNGLQQYLEHLREAAEVLQPTQEMYSRAIAWAREGRSAVDGRAILGGFGLDVTAPENGRRSPVAQALVSKLIAVR